VDKVVRTCVGQPCIRLQRCANVWSFNWRSDDEQRAVAGHAEIGAQGGCVLALTDKVSDAVQTITSGVTSMRSTGTTMWMPLWLSHLARAHAKLGQFDDAWRCIGEAMTAVETTKERWYEAEINRISGEIVLLSADSDVAKAEGASSARLRWRASKRRSPGSFARR
jgi:predicted ATPase